MTENGSKPTGTVIQNHLGTGDNVGEKHVHHAISPAAIQSPVEEILTCLRHRDHATASDKLDTLSATSQLNTQSKSVLELLTILIKLANNHTEIQGYSVIDSYMQSNPEPIFFDIAISTKLRLDIKSEKLNDAEKIYQSIESPGVYSQEVFYEFIAQESELEDILKHGAHLLTEISLCGLIRGFIRCESHTNALKNSEHLLQKYPCFNSSVVNLIAHCNNWSDQLTAHHYWLITATERNRILSLADECIDLLGECEAKDTRTTSLALSFFNFLGGTYEPLNDICWKYINTMEVIDEELGSFIRSLREKNIEGLKGLPYELEKARTNFSYKKSVIDRLKKSQELSSEELLLFGNIADNTTIQKWHDSGGHISSDGELEKQFNEIELLCYANDGSAKATDSLRKSTDSFTRSNEKEMRNLNPARLHGMTSMLLEAHLASQVCTLLQPIMPNSDIWISPIVRNYINALIESQQLTTLNGVLSEINDNDWCDFVWQAHARKLDYQNDLENAISSMERALELSPKSLAIWVYLIHLLKRNSTEPKLYRKYLNRIPNEVFANANKHSCQLLYEVVSNGNYELADSVLVNWFIDNPIYSAKYITDFHFNEATNELRDSERPVLDSTSNCLGGFRYTLDEKEYTKLVVSGVESTHPSIVKDSSKLGEQLLSIAVGETAQYGAYDLTLLEKLAPYVAVFRLSLELRQASNDGSDSFYQFSMPEDPNEMISSLEKKIMAIGDSDKTKFYTDPAYPLFLKGHMLGTDCPVHSALNHLTTKLSVKPPLPNIGEDSPDTIILDIYSVAYLGLTGLIHGLDNAQTKIVITIETHAYLSQFLKDVNRDDYMRIGVNRDGKLWRVTAEDIKKETTDIQSAINHILETSTIVHPNLADMPPSIMRIMDAVDPSVFSSLKLSIVNDIPWLCIDEIFARLSHQSNYPVVNALKYFTHLGYQLDIKNKLPGLYFHVTAGLPYPLTFEELIQMSNVDDDLSHHFLSEILKMYPNVYANSNSAVQHLHKIILLALAKACVDGELLNGIREVNARNNGYTERLFNVCCQLTIQIQADEKAELKLAKLFCAIFVTSDGNSVILKLVRLLGSRFISGHFLSVDAINQHIRQLLP